MLAGRYVLSLRKTGLGDRLFSLCAGWAFARNTGRTLVVDWRHARYAPLGVNLFTRCFTPGPALAGVGLLSGDTIDTARLPRPIYPAAWEEDELLASPWLMPTDSFPEEREKALAMILAGQDIAASTVVFHACLNDRALSFADARTCLQGLTPAPDIAEAVEAYYREHLAAGPVIGLHIRHGNGGDIMGHARYWHAFDAAIERCRRAVEETRRKLGIDARVLLCTDSSEVEDAFRARVSGVICRPKTYRAPNAGELHDPVAAPAGLEDAMVEMLLLARCDALIRYPAGSAFSFYAAVMKPSRAPMPVTIGELQSPFDAEDPLSPTVLI